MLKKIMAILAAAALLTGCLPIRPGTTGSPAPEPQPTLTGAPTPTATPAKTPTPSQGGDEDALKALLPDKAGYRWQYFGFAEYAMTMELKAIGQSNGVLSYTCEGEVADMSGGEAAGDFSVKVTYQVLPGVLKQTLAGEKALDHVYPDLELIRAPLAKGTKWVQAVRDSKGREANLSCAIDDVKTVDGQKVYFITYQAENSDYYEKREITEGIGVTAFDRLYEFENQNNLIGYRLFEPTPQAGAGGWERWLPQLDREYTYSGLAEYGHKGNLIRLSGNDAEEVYEYRGVYHDGVGIPDQFVIRYYLDKARGTVTEQVMSNERGKKKEVNSKLHNLVVLMFPLKVGKTWSHTAKLNGKSVIVHAEITEYDESKGLAKVRYTVKGASGYYDGTYIEERTFEAGYGLTGFSNLLPGDIGISKSDAKDPQKLKNALIQHMFGYSMNKQP